MSDFSVGKDTLNSFSKFSANFSLIIESKPRSVAKKAVGGIVGGALLMLEMTETTRQSTSGLGRYPTAGMVDNNRVPDTANRDVLRCMMGNRF